MGISKWFDRRADQHASGTEGASTPKKPFEPTIISLGSSPPDTPATGVLSPAGGEEVLALEKRPEFGRLASWRGGLILLVTSGSQFLDNVFMTSANMALSSIQDEFGVSSNNLQWMISAYTLTFGGFLLLSGVLSDRYESPWLMFLQLILTLA